MSTIQMELSEQASDLGFASIEEAEANGYAVDYNGETWVLKPDVNKAHEDLAEQEKQAKEAKQIEMVYECLGRAKDMIALIYKPEDEKFANPLKQITDKKIQEYYYELNTMCCELADRNIMAWQKEDENENQD